LIYLFLEQGKLELIINNQQKRDLLIGESFGELALLFNAPRSASILASTKAYLWGIDRSTFR